MSDQGKFINTYIDTIISTLHEMLNNNLQMKTQIKISGDMLTEKDEHIARLTATIDEFNQNQSNSSQTIQTNNQEISDLRNQVSRIQQDLQAAQSKASHVDSLLQQVVDMKNEIKNRDVLLETKTQEFEKVIADKNAEIEKLKVKKVKSLAKVIETPELNKVSSTKEKDDDF